MPNKNGALVLYQLIFITPRSLTIAMRCSHFFVLAFIGFVSARTIYDVHAFERLNTTELLALQRSRGMTNAKILAEGVKRLQPPKPLASKIVEGKKRRANPVGTNNGSYLQQSVTPEAHRSTCNQIPHGKPRDLPLSYRMSLLIASSSVPQN